MKEHSAGPHSEYSAEKWSVVRNGMQHVHLIPPLIIMESAYYNYFYFISVMATPKNINCFRAMLIVIASGNIENTRRVFMVICDGAAVMFVSYHSYFQYGWGWSLSTGPLKEFALLQKPLGPPLGAYKRTSPDGWEFTREFEKAGVWVNTETREGRITWH